MLVKVCNQVVTPIPFTLQTTAAKERRVIPINSKEFRYLRFRAIGCSEVAGQNGNHDSFPYGEFENEAPGYGYKSFINKRAHVEHNCTPPGTLIQMANGSYKPIEEIVEGDQVITHKGVSRVSKTFQYFNQNSELVKIDALGIHSAIPLTRQHPVWIIPKNRIEKAHKLRRLARQKVLANEQEWDYDLGINAIIDSLPEPVFTYAEDVSIGDLLIIPKGEVVLKEDLEISDLGYARLFGFYVSEGNTSGNYNVKGEKLHQYVQFSTHIDEIDILDEIRTLANRLQIGNVTNRLSSNSDANGIHNCRIVNLFSSKFANLCVKHCGRLAKGKNLSQEVLSMPREWKIAFLDAYFQGDGWFDEENCAIKSSTASKILSLQLQQMIHSLGATATVRELTQHTPNSSWVKNSFGNPIYVLNLSATQVSKLFEKDFGERQSAQHLLSTKYGVATRVTNIEIIPYTGEVFNIEVENDNSYVAGGVIVHNSSSGLKGSIGDLPDAFLNRFSFEGITLPTEFASAKALSWEKLAGKKYADFRGQILNLPNQRDGSIEVLMRIDTNLVKSATIEPKTKALLERIVRMIDTGQRLTCSMGANVRESRCSVCGNLAQFSYQYCEHLKPTRKGGLSIVSANQIRDLLDKDYLRPEWLKHLIASSYDVQEILKGASNKGVAARNIEINHGVSFFELSVVATPAYPDAIALEKLARQQTEDRKSYLKRLYKDLGKDTVLDLYGFLEAEGVVSNLCHVT